MAAEISFWAGQNGLDTQFGGSFSGTQPGSGLGFYGSSFGTSVQVGQYPESTFIASADGATEGPQANNCKYNGDVSGVLWNGSGTAVHVNTIPNESGALKVSFTYDSAVQTQNGLCTIHDRVNKDNDPSEISAYVAQLVNPTNSGVGEVSGSGVDPVTGSAQAWNSGEDGWIQCHGSGQTLTLLNGPGESGLHTGGDNTSGTRHDWYFALSASPDSIGSKTNVGIYFETEYL